MMRVQYRLTVLQLLVATTVVAVFVALNRWGSPRITYSGEVKYLTGLVRQVDVLEYKLGWPEPYYGIREITDYGAGKQLLTSGWPFHADVTGQVDWSNLSFNLGLVVITVGFAIAVTWAWQTRYAEENYLA